MANQRFKVHMASTGEIIDAGYEVEDTCWRPGCLIDIDRGADYLCGQFPGGDEYGCGGYFCKIHRYPHQHFYLCWACSPVGKREEAP